MIEPRIQQARWSLIVLFALLGLSYSSWLGRLPTVKERLALSEAELGLVFLAGAVGSLVCVTFAGSLVQRFGGRTLLTVSAFGISVAFLLEGLGPTIGSVELLALGIFLNGCFVALTNVPQNVETAAVERRIGRAILPHFHAAYSIGAVLGALIGAACSAANVHIMVQLGATSVIALIVRLILIPRVIVDTELTPHERWDRALSARKRRVERVEIKAGIVVPTEPRTLAVLLRSRRASLGSALGAWRERRTLLIGVVIFAAAMSEGSANNWLAIAVVTGFDKTESTGAIMLSVFLVSMTIVRLAGTRLIDRYGRVAVLAGSGVTSAIGLVLFGVAPSFPLAIVGIVLWGAGAALAVPLGISAASDDPLKAAARVSVVSAFASTASLAAPPVLGFVADVTGTRLALTLIVVFLIIAVLVSRNVAPLPRTAAVHSSGESTP
ncbi:MFS transporter [Jonesia quinghaiensis]|uniref:MFS transporter n=1 Tax=Jonesia quinghaiensis TaxID=262806 RepID=UPI0004290688|nr:MFS transporter [Jonesia quinghaiensis]